MTLAALRLNKNEDRRLRAGHVWVFSNEVDTRATPLTQFQPGDPVLIEDAAGHVLGTGYVNPHALICARLVSRDPKYVLDQSLLTHRLNIALSLRERLFDAPYYRLAFGDSDGLPGLVVDRYGDILVAQITTAGVERLKTEVVAALVKAIAPRAILFRNDTSSRELEGLTSYVETAHGEVPETVQLSENGVTFSVPLHTGQKTGWFYDQRENRARFRLYVKGARVLDLFSYLGAWGVQAAAAGAASVLCVDSSPKAVEGIRHNTELNRVEDRVTVEREEAFEMLRRLRAARERFDVVVIDPPAFIKRKKDVKEGTQAYQRLNQMAMQVLSKDGFLVSCSCSYHLHRDDLRDILLKSSRHIDRFLEILEEGHQGPDHPVHPAIPETAYLKAFFTRLLPN
ncbi:MAG TPA: class I SAM-dependent rRNA methyltransferase [Candidatus Methylomirabilis sp.]|nr:class I SAM-dependent rRNA methyltransferase [Candidatus Methylomirabilis sp.]